MLVLHIFNLTLSLEKALVLWKTSCVVPVKTVHPREPNHFRLMALSSHLMKTMERIVLNRLRPQVSSKLDPLKFAYQLGIEVDETVIYLLHRSFSHLENPGSTARVMVFDFSRVFRTIQPSLLRGKLEGVGVDCHLAAWTVDTVIDFRKKMPQTTPVKLPGNRYQDGGNVQVPGCSPKQ